MYRLVIEIEHPMQYSCPSILKPPIQAEIYGLKLNVVLKLKDICIETITASCITENGGNMEWMGLIRRATMQAAEYPGGWQLVSD